MPSRKMTAPAETSWCRARNHCNLRLISASSFTNICHLPPFPCGKGVADPIGPSIRMAENEGNQWCPGRVHLDRQIVFLPMTKNGLSREVPLTQRAKSILDAQKTLDIPSPFPVTANALRMAWDRLLKRADISGLRFHDLRHEAISRFFEMGLSLPEVALISGHKDPRMLFRYTHLKVESVALRIQSL